MTRHLAPTVAIVALLAATPTRGAGTPAKCAAAKQKAAAVKLLKKVKCYGRALVRADPVDVECLTKADAKFLASWGKIEADGGCVTTNDADSIEARVDQFVADLLVLLPPTTTTTTTTLCGGFLGPCCSGDVCSDNLLECVN